MFCFGRELTEESGLKAENLTKVGKLTFEFIGDPLLLEIHVYTGSTFTGEPTESDGLF